MTSAQHRSTPWTPLAAAQLLVSSWVMQSWSACKPLFMKSWSPSWLCSCINTLLLMWTTRIPVIPLVNIQAKMLFSVGLFLLTAAIKNPATHMDTTLSEQCGRRICSGNGPLGAIFYFSYKPAENLPKHIACLFCMQELYRCWNSYFVLVLKSYRQHWRC